MTEHIPLEPAAEEHSMAAAGYPFRYLLIGWLVERFLFREPAAPQASPAESQPVP